ncbi:MAG TPA: dihydrofolate reductase [Burkholderiaceae bacterium]|nr:dihydrofolate reductase [Burkholderiaceae bacterium]
MTRIHLIVARARNGVIGRHGTLPWHLPEDLAHFKRTTMGHTVIMGRKTWDSIGRPLPGRRNIVITRNPQWQAPGAETATSLEQALQKCASAAGESDRDVFIIGGAQLYAQALKQRVDSIFLTEIDADFEGDVHFPTLDPAHWRERSREHFAPGAGRAFGFDFVRYELVGEQRPNS